MRPRDRRILIAVIAAMWIATGSDGIFTHDWQGFTISSGIMVFVAGYAFGVNLMRRITGEAVNGDG